MKWPVFQAIIVAMCLAASAIASETSITYQGELRRGGSAASGSFDMDFALWDAFEGGSQVGSAVEVLGVSVDAGVFTVELDFGAAAFDGADRWLEISMGEAGDPTRFTLTPRQAITSSPYSIQTRGIYVDDAGRVGIGMTSPQADLHIEAEAPSLRLTSTDTSPATTSTIELQDGRAPGLARPMGQINFLDPDGVSQASITGAVLGGVSGTLTFNVTPGEVSHMYITPSYVRVRDNLQLVRGTDLSTAGELHANGADSYLQMLGGNLGIGTDTPTHKLDVQGDVGSERFTIGHPSGYISSMEPSGNHLWFSNFAGGSISLATYTGPLVALPRLTVTSSGNVGIGTTTPFDGRLHVVGDENEPNGIHAFTDRSGGTAIYGHSGAPSGFNSGVLGESNSPDGVGMYAYNNAGGIALLAQAFQSGSTAIKAIGIAGGNGVEGYGDTGAYDFFAGGAGVNYGSSSSIRWKSNIEPIPDPLDKIAQIRGVYYDWDEAHGGHHDVGMIAEEVGQVLPEIVNYEENGVDAVGMDYSKLTPLLVEAVKALRAEHAAEVERLERRIRQLEEMIDHPGSVREESAQ
ncbi:MAG: tail fiber domain-containing protein [Phycisphaeraceae bacterium]|nr:MAG: tail fiber domain-containing protein [Phycisphaeraceae bacterium]